MPSAVLQHASGHKNTRKCSLSRADREENSNNGTLAVLMFTEDGELYGTVTVNLNHPLQSDSLAFLDENNLPGIGKWLKSKNLGIYMGVNARSGFCTYPLYMLF